MSSDRFEATYLIETPLDPAHVAEVLAGEQSCGTFARVEGETDALRVRARANVESVELLDVAERPSLPNGWMQRRGMLEQPHAWQRARLRVSFPVGNVGAQPADAGRDGLGQPVRPGRSDRPAP